MEGRAERIEKRRQLVEKRKNFVKMRPAPVVERPEPVERRKNPAKLFPRRVEFRENAVSGRAKRPQACVSHAIHSRRDVPFKRTSFRQTNPATEVAELLPKLSTLTPIFCSICTKRLHNGTLFLASNARC